MTDKDEMRELHQEELEQVVGGAFRPGIYKPGRYKEASKDFFKNCVGQQTYDLAMGSEAGKRHHYVAARAFLQQSDWEKFVWIEQYGSLEGYPG